jgi:tRNA/rRNA methyltransferase
MSAIRIVLVEPQEAGNVGAVARAMKNFGFSDLVIVGAKPDRNSIEAEWWASGAEDLVRSARMVGSLQDAISDCQLTIATTSARGRKNEEPVQPREVVGLRALLRDDDTLALVFGREASGLTSQEIALCHRTAAIPTSTLSPTMNLAQAVCVFCYELVRDAAVVADPRELAQAALVERMHQEARQLLVDTGFLHENNPDRIYKDLRTIAGRALLDEREVTILLGIVRQVRWKLAQRDYFPT